MAADVGMGDGEIATHLSSSTSTVFRTKRRFVEEGLEASIYDRPRPGSRRKLKPKDEATLVALACAEPPSGRSRWTLQLLADHLVALTEVESVSASTVSRRLAEKKLKPWQKKVWCIPKVDAHFVASMEAVLDLYARPSDPACPIVCFDETLKQLVAEARTPFAAAPGRPERVDYEYRRNGTANLFVYLDRHRGWREVKVTERRGYVDFAECMRDLVDLHYPDARCIHVVLDNLNTHRPGALYRAFPADEARRVLRRIEFHYTPKHASWLNMVEIEIGVLVRQCLSRRIPDRETLQREAAVWVSSRNDSNASINWLFSVDGAREKLGRSYPSIGQES